MRIQAVHLLIGLVAATGIFLFYKSCSGPITVEYSKPSTEVSVSKTISLGFTEEQYQRATKFERREFASSGSHVPLKINAQVPRQCQWGDMDIIENEAKYSDRKDFLITVESPLGSEAFEPLIKSVSIEELMRGYKAEFLIPLSEPTALGLYFCKDSDHTYSCVNKEVIEPNSIYNTYLKTRGNSSALPPGYKASDKIYFFQFIFLENATSFSVFKEHPNKDRIFALVGHYMNLKLDQPEKNDKVMVQVKKLTNTIRSFPLEGKENTVKLLFPKQDYSKCGELVRK